MKPRDGQEMKEDVGEESDMEEDMMDQESEPSGNSMDVSSSDDDDDDYDDEYDSSDINEEEYERRKATCSGQLGVLESQFSFLKEHLYSARLRQTDRKLAEIRAETSADYLAQVKQLEEDMRIRKQVAEILKSLRMKNLDNILLAEKQASEQNFESEKSMLYDMLNDNLEEDIRRLEEDRNNADVHTDIFYSSQPQVKKRRVRQTTDPFGSPERRRKPVTVSGPHIIYMLHDEEVIDDLTRIKKAIKQAEKQAKKRDQAAPAPQPESPPPSPGTEIIARYEDEKLFYQNEWYSKNHRIEVIHRDTSEGTVHAVITAISAGEVWIKRVNGTRSKLYINQLQKGKYIIKHRVTS